jgi:hypothetical protein
LIRSASIVPDEVLRAHAPVRLKLTSVLFSHGQLSVDRRAEQGSPTYSHQSVLSLRFVHRRWVDSAVKKDIVTKYDVSSSTGVNPASTMKGSILSAIKAFAMLAL